MKIKLSLNQIKKKLKDLFNNFRKKFKLILKVIFIGTKKQFTNIIEKCANRSNSYYVTQRWLGGMLTNWKTIKNCLTKLQNL